MTLQQNVSKEGCVDCAAALSQTGGGIPSNPSPGVSGGQEKDNFTYNEGNGVKDKIVLTGPMSEQYTQALAVYFAKRTLDSEGNEVPPETPAEVAQQMLSTESIMMMEDEAMRKAFDEVHQASPVGHLGEFYDFAQIENDPDGVTVSGYFMSDSIALQPEVVEQVEQHVRDSNKRVIVVVVGASQGVTRGTGFRQKFIEVDTAGKQTMFDQGSELSLAREAYYDKKGITVVNGVLGFFQELQRTAKK